MNPYLPTNPTRRRFLRLAATGAALLAVPALSHAQTASQPLQPTQPQKNVLFIISDDLNTELGSYGNALVQSPNIDRLAALGTRFDRAYCQSPWCGPSRASLLTGLRPDTTQVFDLVANPLKTVPGAINLPRWFRQHGYYTARSGKVFHQGVGPNYLGGDGPDDKAAWDEKNNPNWTPIARTGVGGNLTPGQGAGTALNVLETNGTDEDHPDGQTATFITQKLRERAADKKPFFLAAGFYMPHVPLWAPAKYFAPYPIEKITLATNRSRKGAPPAAFNQGPDLGMTEQKQKQAIRGYYAATSFMDAQVGKLLDELQRSGLSNNTVIVFWGDHGFHLGSHQMWGKKTLFEESARAPLMIFDPSQKARGAVVTNPVEFVDIYPTLVELCGLPKPPQELAGQSLRPLLDNPAAPFKAAAYTQIERESQIKSGPMFMGRSVRTSHYRYTEWDEGRKGVELYDEQADPGETVNLTNSPASEPIIAQMKPLLRRMTPVTAPFVLPSPSLQK